MTGRSTVFASESYDDSLPQLSPASPRSLAPLRPRRLLRPGFSKRGDRR